MTKKEICATLKNKLGLEKKESDVYDDSELVFEVPLDTIISIEQIKNVLLQNCRVDTCHVTQVNNIVGILI